MWSSVRSTWEPLGVDHILEILESATYLRKEREWKHFTFAKNLSLEESRTLATAIREWTAGAPHSVIYALHMLQVLRKKNRHWFKSKQGLCQVFQFLEETVSADVEIETELGDGTPRDEPLSANELLPYHYFCFCS